MDCVTSPLLSFFYQLFFSSDVLNAFGIVIMWKNKGFPSQILSLRATSTIRPSLHSSSCQSLDPIILHNTLFHWVSFQSLWTLENLSLPCIFCLYFNKENKSNGGLRLSQYCTYVSFTYLNEPKVNSERAEKTCLKKTSITVLQVMPPCCQSEYNRWINTVFAMMWVTVCYEERRHNDLQ